MELDPRVSPRIAGFLIEDEICGLHVNRVLEFSRSGLIGSSYALRVRLQIDRDLARASHISGLLVILKVFTVNLIEARRTLAVDRHHHVCEFDAASSFELHR